MKVYPWLCIVLLAAGCSNSPKPSSGKDSIPPLVGYYESADPIRLISLTLRRSGDVDMLTDSLNNTPEKIQIGNWMMMPDSTGVQLTLLTIGSGSSVRDTLRFQLQDSSLITSGTVFTKKERPAPAEKMLIIWLKNEQQCDRGPGFGKTVCYDVRYGEKPTAGWTRLAEPIDSFTFEKGFIYKLKVARIPRDPRVQDIGAYQYKLAEVLEKTPG